MQPEHIKAMNDSYRDQEPSDLHKTAFADVIVGDGLDEDDVAEMYDMLYEPFPDRMKDHPVDPWEPALPFDDKGNGLARAVSRNEFGVFLHISEKLWRHQPIGVLLRPIGDEVGKAGEALITDVTPRSTDVEDHIMPAEHIKLKLEPLPVWLSKWVGDDGYPLL